LELGEQHAERVAGLLDIPLQLVGGQPRRDRGDRVQALTEFVRERQRLIDLGLKLGQVDREFRVDGALAADAHPGCFPSRARF
jgi:hypothetical protein